MDVKPCPFCGSEPYTDQQTAATFGNRSGWNYAIACSCCETVCSVGCDTFEQAIIEWNTRHIPEGYALVRVEPNKDDLIIQSWTSNPTNGWRLSVPSGIKITHIPTGFTAFCESERSQHKNREIAMAEIKAMIAAAQDET